MYCPNCGTAFNSRDCFCGKCGNTLQSIQSTHFCIDPLFVSQITYSLDMIKSYLRTWWLKSNQWIAFLIAAVFLVFGIVLLANNSLVGGIIGTAFGGSILFLLVIVFVSAFTGHKRSYAQICEHNSGHEQTQTVQFFNENIVMINTANDSKSHYNYSSIKRITANKKFVMFQTRTDLMIVVDKARFSVGTPDNLVVFIKTKLRSK